MVIGAKYSRKRLEKRNKKALKLTEELYSKFKQQFSSPCCRVLRKGIDFEDKRLFEHCRAITADTAHLVIELLKE